LTFSILANNGSEEREEEREEEYLLNWQKGKGGGGKS
jgi:hypothetical protein